MDRLEDYLESIRRSLDVRNKVEQEEIVVEMRDHILTLAERLEAEGRQPEQAIEEAIQRMGDGLLVASRVSEAHDGGSWRQAWVAAVPIALSMVLPFVGILSWRSSEAWPLSAASLIILVACYCFLSPRITGRRWRMPWLAGMVSSALGAARGIGYSALTPAALRKLVFEDCNSPLPVVRSIISGAEPLSVREWNGIFQHHFTLMLIVVLAVATIIVLANKNRWSHVALTALPLILVPSAIHREEGAGSFLMLSPYSVVLCLALIYLVFIEDWKGDWTMAWVFCLPLLLSAVVPAGGYWQAALVNAIMLAAVGATIVLYSRGRRAHSESILASGAILFDLGLWLFASLANRAITFPTFFMIIYFAMFRWFMGYYDRKFHEREQPSLPFDLPLGY